MTWSLTSELIKKRGIDLSFSSVGSLYAQEHVHNYLRDARLDDLSIAKPTGRLANCLLESSNTANGRWASFADLGLRVFNLVRTPMDHSELASADFWFSFYAGIPKQVRSIPSLKAGIYVHDLIPLLMPEYASKQQRRTLGRILRTIRRGDLVVVNSECTARDLADYLDWRREDIDVVPLAADPTVFYRAESSVMREDVQRRYALPHGRYFLTLHNAAPHKNMSMLIKAYANYCDQTQPSERLPLVVAGGKGDPRREILNQGGLKNSDLENIHFVGFVEERDLSIIYSNASAFYFPSIYEGFGLPPLEALFCGVPIFISDSASLPEILAPLSGAHAGSDRLLPPDDVDAWAYAFSLGAKAPPLDSSAIEQVQTQYSWSKANSRLLDLMRSRLTKS
jgi:glycosyltransferase involved in cell wall biosynthesis